MCCEDVLAMDLADRFGTPLYVYSYNTFIGHFLKLKIRFCQAVDLLFGKG
jgi:diaminopimelate decarboxylase